MKISHLETFAKLAVTGSFTRAAHDLFTTQPTVTTHIQLLEQELGYQLFTRSRNSVRLTENGKMLFQKVEEIFRLMDSIKGAKTKADDGLSGTLNIAASWFWFLRKNVSLSCHFHERKRSACYRLW